MDCERVAPLISAELAGEIEAADHAELELHLAQCAACNAVATAFRAQDEELRRVFVARRRAAATVANRALAEIEQIPGRTGRRTGWLLPVLSAAAGFLIATLLF